MRCIHIWNMLVSQVVFVTVPDNNDLFESARRTNEDFHDIFRRWRRCFRARFTGYFRFSWRFRSRFLNGCWDCRFGNWTWDIFTDDTPSHASAILRSGWFFRRRVFIFGVRRTDSASITSGCSQPGTRAIRSIEIIGSSMFSLKDS